MQNNGCCRSWSFKVTSFCTNRKPVCDFLLVNHSVIVNDILSCTVFKISLIVKLSVLRAVHLFNARIWGEPIYSGLWI